MMNKYVKIPIGFGKFLLIKIRYKDLSITGSTADAFDFLGVTRKYRVEPDLELDSINLTSDWYRVGNGIKKAM